jgi:hypothetical protein
MILGSLPDLAHPQPHPIIPLFLHIPKTAGTTLNDCIYDQYANAPKILPQDRAERGWLCEGVFYYPGNFLKPANPKILPWIRSALAREDITSVVGHFQFGIHRLLRKPSTYVTLIREPVDRVLSLYYHLAQNVTIDQFMSSLDLEKTKQNATLYYQLMLSEITPREFVSCLALREVDNDQTRRIAGLEPPFGRCNEGTMNRAKDNLVPHFSIVGTTHRFDETIVLLKRILKWGNPYYLPALVNKARPPRSAIPAETISLI